MIRQENEFGRLSLKVDLSCYNVHATSQLSCISTSCSSQMFLDNDPWLIYMQTQVSKINTQNSSPHRTGFLVTDIKHVLYLQSIKSLQRIPHLRTIRYAKWLANIRWWVCTGTSSLWTLTSPSVTLSLPKNNNFNVYFEKISISVNLVCSSSFSEIRSEDSFQTQAGKLTSIKLF